MKNDDNFNIFSSSAHKRKPVPAKKSPAPPPPPPPPRNEESTSSNQEDVSSMLKRMHEIHQDIQTKLEITYTKGGISPRTLEKYVNSMTPEQRSSIDQEIEKLEDQVWSAVGSIPKAKRVSKKTSKATKTRKGKMIGARKKWIPMK